VVCTNCEAGIGGILSLVFCVFYFFASLSLCLNAGGRTVPGMSFLPFNALYGAQPVCAFLLFLVFIKQTFEIIQKMLGKEENIQC
jgi:TRAP-type C4-dicarboxylate transport system permease small subunit